MIMLLTMERRMRRKSRVRCEAGENLEMISKDYLSLYTIFGGFAPNSDTADTLSKSLGKQTVMSGYVTTGKNDPSQSLQMIGRDLMTPDELKALPKGSFIVTKTGTHPMQTKLELFFKWGIVFDAPYEIAEKPAREVKYASAGALKAAILKRYPQPEKSPKPAAIPPKKPQQADEKKPPVRGA